MKKTMVLQMMTNVIFITFVVHVCVPSTIDGDCPVGYEKIEVSDERFKCCKACLEGQKLIDRCKSHMYSNICGTTTTEAPTVDITSMGVSTKAAVILPTVSGHSYASFPSTARPSPSHRQMTTVSTASLNDEITSVGTSAKVSRIVSAITSNSYTSFQLTTSPSSHSPIGTVSAASPPTISTGNPETNHPNSAVASCNFDNGTLVVLILMSICTCIIWR